MYTIIVQVFYLIYLTLSLYLIGAVGFSQG